MSAAECILLADVWGTWDCSFRGASNRQTDACYNRGSPLKLKTVSERKGETVALQCFLCWNMIRGIMGVGPSGSTFYAFLQNWSLGDFNDPQETPRRNMVHLCK